MSLAGALLLPERFRSRVRVVVAATAAGQDEGAGEKRRRKCGHPSQRVSPSMGPDTIDAIGAPEPAVVRRAVRTLADRTP